MKTFFYLLIILFLISFSQNGFSQSQTVDSVKFNILNNDTSLCTSDCLHIKAEWDALMKTDSYNVFQVPYLTYPSYPYAGTQLSVNTDDVYSPLTTMPFPFCFFNNGYTSCVVGSNGVITFNASLASGYCAWSLINAGTIPTPNLVTNSIMGPYQDIDPSIPGTGGIFWQVYGTAPYRKYVASFNNIPLFGLACHGLAGSIPEKSQIILHETTNKIDIKIDYKKACTSWNDGLAIEGIQNATGTFAYPIPGRNNTVWSDTFNIYRFAPAGDTATNTIEWFDQNGNLLATGTDSFTYCVTSLPMNIIGKITHNLCTGGNIVLTDTLHITGQTDVLMLNYDTSHLHYPQPYFVEGCDSLNFTLNRLGACYSGDSIKVKTYTSGNATNGLDYTYLDSFYVLPTQNYTGTLHFIQDGINEGFETANIMFIIPDYNDTVNTIMSFTINDSIYVNALAYDNGICPLENQVIGVVGDDSILYTWNPTTFLTSPNTATTNVKPAYSINPILSANWHGCPTVKREFPIQVDTFRTIVKPNDTTVCYGISFLLNATTSVPSGTYTWAWSPTTGLNDATLQNPSIIPTNSGLYTVQATSANGCTAGDAINIVVTPKEFISLSDSDYIICPKEFVQFSASNATDYLWVPGLYLDDSTIANPTCTPYSPIEYTLYAVNSLGCKDTTKVRVQLVPGAVLELGPNVTLYPDENIQVYAAGNCSYFTWQPTSNMDNANISNPIFNYNAVSSATMYTCVGTTEQGCSATDTIYVNYESGEVIEIANAFSPGGSNSLSSLPIITRGIVNLKYYRIFNRWGQLVFETANLQDSWDGNYNGVPQPMGNYVYSIQATTSTGKVVNKKGNVMLIR